MSSSQDWAPVKGGSYSPPPYNSLLEDSYERYTVFHHCKYNIEGCYKLGAVANSRAPLNELEALSSGG